MRRPKRTTRRPSQQTEQREQPRLYLPAPTPAVVREDQQLQAPRGAEWVDFRID